MIQEKKMEEKRIDANELRLLSRLFSYPEKLPDPSELEKIGSAWGKASPEAGSREEASGGNGSGGVGLGEDGLRTLQNEYVRLFINALPEVSCPPYGSFYLEGSLMGASTVRLQNLYLSYGFVTESMYDHIAVELEFLALLPSISRDYPVDEDYRFLIDHLGQWTPRFFSRVRQNDATGFYRDLSNCAGTLLFSPTT